MAAATSASLRFEFPGWVSGMKYLIVIVSLACAMVWDFTRNHGAYTETTVRVAHDFVRDTL